MFFMITVAAQAQDVMPAIDFFMYDRLYEVFLRDYFRFEEPKPLRIEYWYVNWQDTESNLDEYRDLLHIEGAIPIHFGDKLMVDIPFQYSHAPLFAEDGNNVYGNNISFVNPYLITRWWITDRFKSIIGWQFSLKGDSDTFGEVSGRRICLLKGLFSYDLNTQLNFVAGARLDRYYYDTDKEHDVDDEPDTFRLARRLYYRPAAMLNWHPNDNLTVLLGIPDTGFSLSLGDLLKAEARAAIDKKIEVAIGIRPANRIRNTLRFLNTPYTEVPIKSTTFQEDSPPAERLYYTNKSIVFELGWELNPASLASVGLRYSPSSELEFKDRNYEDVIKMDSNPSYAIGATFTVDIEALLGRQ
jgi:hypothetical protein